MSPRQGYMYICCSPACEDNSMCLCVCEDRGREGEGGRGKEEEGGGGKIQCMPVMHEMMFNQDC